MGGVRKPPNNRFIRKEEKNESNKEQTSHIPVAGCADAFGNGGVCRLQPAGNGVQDVLREALEQEKLAEGEESSFGLFVKTVDGETVDDGNQEWWCLTKGGEMWNYGVDDTKIADGDAFEFTFTEGY